MAAHDTAEGFLEPVKAADVVAVAVGDQDGGDARLPQLSVIIHDLLGPRAVWFARVHHHHMVVGVANEIDVCSAWVHGPETARVLFNMGGVDVLGDLHRPVLAL